MMNIRDVWLARKRIAGLVEKTPLIFSKPLSNIAGKNMYLKLENLNVTGSFKIRGAANKLLQLTPEERKKGVVTFSTGNFGRSVAYAAKKLDIPASICISNRVPDVKVSALENSGAHILKIGASQDDAEEHCYHLRDEQGLTVVHPFDDPSVIAGQGTIGIEIFDDLPNVDTVLAGLSGGGLHSGLGLVLKEMDQGIRLAGISVAGSAAMYESLQRGHPVEIEEIDTLADSLLGGVGKNNQYTCDLVKKYVDHILLMEDKSIAAGMAFMLKHHHMVIEGAAATGIGAVLEQAVDLGKENVIVVTGSSVDPSTVLNVMKENM